MDELQPLPEERPREQPAYWTVAEAYAENAYVPLPRPSEGAGRAWPAYAAAAVMTAAATLVLWISRPAPISGAGPAPGEAPTAAAAPASLPIPALADALPPAPQGPIVDELVPFDPARASDPAGPAPVLASAGPAAFAQPRVEGAPAALSAARPVWVPQAFHPEARLKPLPSFWGRSWRPGAAARAAEPRAQYEASARADAPVDILRRTAQLVARGFAAQIPAQPCPQCQSAASADRLPSAPALGRVPQAVRGSLVYQGRCDGQYLYGVVNRDGRTATLTVRNSDTGEAWTLANMRSGETRYVRSAVPLNTR